MNSFQLIAHIQNFLNAIQSQEYFLDTIKSFPTMQEKLLQDFLLIIRGVTNSYEQGDKAKNALSKKFSGLNTWLQSIKSGQIFTSASILEHAVIAFAKGNDGTPQIQGIAKNILDLLQKSI